MLGMCLYKLGEFIPARTHFERGLALYVPQQHHALAFLYVEDPGVICLARAAAVQWALGYPDQALQQSYTARSLARELSHAFSLGYALAWIVMVPLGRREIHTVSAWAEELIALSTEHGFAQALMAGTIVQGRTLAAQGQVEEGIAQMRQGLTAWRALGVKTAVPYFLAMLAEAYGACGQAAEGLLQLTEALAVIHDTREQYQEAEVHRLKGELLLQQDLSDALQAEACFQQALAIARRQQAKSWELRAAMSLSRLWQQRGKRTEARELLAPIYGWFTEGFDTADLQEAKALLEVLG
jgi:predicted ATPase